MNNLGYTPRSMTAEEFDALNSKKNCEECITYDESYSEEYDERGKEFEANLTPESKHGAKYDDGKIFMGVLADFAIGLEQVARVGTFGANKYVRKGWKTVPDAETRYYDAMWRHLLADNINPVDDDSQCLHLAQVAWNALAVLHFRLNK